MGKPTRAAETTAIVTEENLADMTFPNPIYGLCNSAKFFANQNSAGKLIQGTQVDENGIIPGSASELSTDVEDAVLLAF